MLNNFLLLKMGGLLEIGFLKPGLQCVTEIFFITVSTRNKQLCTDFFCTFSSYVLRVLFSLFEVITLYIQ